MENSVVFLMDISNRFFFYPRPNQMSSIVFARRKSRRTFRGFLLISSNKQIFIHPSVLDEFLELARRKAAAYSEVFPGSSQIVSVI
jgi:hypothetical protein